MPHALDLGLGVTSHPIHIGGPGGAGGDASLTLHQEFAGNTTLAGAATAGPTLTFTRASDGTYFDSSGVLQTATTNAARFDHDPANSNAALGLLVEESRTNVILQSEDISTSWTNQLSTESVNSTAAPDGNTTGDTIILDGAFNSQQGMTQIVGGLDRTISWCGSCFVKADTHDFFQIAIWGTFANRIRVNFDLTDGSVGTADQLGEAGAITAAIKDVGGGWYRVSAASVLQTTAGTGVTMSLYLAGDKTTTGNWTSTAGDSMVVWGMQLEQGATPSSYIANTTGTATRALDAYTTATLSWLDTAATAVGTWYVRGSFPYVDATANALLTLDDGGTTDRFYFERDAAENINYSTTNSGDTDGLVSGTAVIAVDTEFKVAASYADDDIVSAIDGSLETADTTAAIPLTDNPTTLRIGADSGGNQWNGHIAEVRYYDVQKDDSFLTSETT